MQKKNNLQAVLLTQLRRQGQTIRVITTNGFQMDGRLAAFDDYTLLLEGKDGQRLVFKHAVSTLIPGQPIQLKQSGSAGLEGEEELS